MTRMEWLKVPSIILRATAGIAMALDGAYREAVDMAMREFGGHAPADPLYVPDDALTPEERSELLHGAVVPKVATQPHGGIDIDDPSQVSLNDLADLAAYHQN